METIFSSQPPGPVRRSGLLRRWLACTLLLLWLPLLWQPALALEDKRVALVIGNSTYPSASLKNPVNDAKDMAARLRAMGFEVVERNNLTIKQIGGTLREFRSKLAPGAVALVFYAGHGIQIKGENFLPAVDADINSEEDVPNQSLSLKQIIDLLDESKSRLNLVFLDACRNNPYARSFRSGDHGLARVSAPAGTLISYATRPGSVAADGSGRNGLYTSKLLSQMTSKQPIELALKRVFAEVKRASDGKQEPWMEGSIEGDFCFAGCGNDSAPATIANTPSPALPTPAPINAPVLPPIANAKESKSNHRPLRAEPGVDAESALWAEVQKGNSVDDYEVYINQYPKGKYLPLAKNRVKKLQEEAQLEAARKEQEAWDSADQIGSEASLQSYLKAWPNGRFSGLAQLRLKRVQSERAAQLALQQEDAAWKKAQQGASRSAIKTYLEQYPGGRYLAQAKALDERYQRTPPRPNLPIPLPDDIWRTIETSEAWLNLPKVRAYSVTSQSSQQIEYTGSKSATLPRPAATTENNNKQGQPIGERCLQIKDKSGTHFQCGMLSLGYMHDGKLLTKFKKIDELNGSLFPPRVGAKMSLKYQLAYVPDAKFDSSSSLNCEVLAQIPGSSVDSRLPGQVWHFQCNSVYMSGHDNKPINNVFNDYFIEDWGIMLSHIGVYDGVNKKMILPSPGSQTVLVAEGEYGSRITNTYRQHEWSLGQ